MKTESSDFAHQVNVPLTEVTVCARTSRAFDFLHQDLTCTSLLLSTCQKKLLLQRGEKFPVPYDLSQFMKVKDFEENIFEELLVLQCRPLNSGLLDLKTQIVVVDKGNEFTDAETTCSAGHCKEVPILSEFLLNLSASNHYNSIGNVLDRIVLNQKDASFRNTSLNLFLNCKQLQGKLHQKCMTDLCNMVVLEESHVSKFNLYDGDWVEIKLKSEPKSYNGETKSQVCQVKIVRHKMGNRGQDCNGFYALPQLFYALKLRDLRALELGTEILYRRYQYAEGREDQGCSVSSGGAPPFIKELHISCVQSPTYSPGDSYKQLLQNYFMTPRVVMHGTILSIDTEDDPEYWQNITEISEVRKPVLYFKVMKLHPKMNGCKFYMASSRETTLYLDGTVQSFVPSLMSYALKSTQLQTLISPPGLEEYVDEIATFISPSVHQRASGGGVNPSVFVSGPPGCGKSSVVSAVSGYLNMHCYQVNCHELCGETSGATEARIKHTLQRAYSYAPCVLLLRNVDALGKDRDGTADDPRVASSFVDQISLTTSEQTAKLPVFVIATTSNLKAMSADLQEGFLHHVEIESPSENTRHRMLQVVLTGLDIEKDVSLKHIAQRTAGMVLGDIQALVSFVKKSALERIINYCKAALGHHALTWREEASIQRVGFPLSSGDFNAALDRLQATHSDTLGAPKIPNIKWEDIGGLSSVKSEILDTIQLPLQHPELFASGLRRSGVLFYGPPGTGKTLLAKAVATEFSLNFLNVKGPELINMYVGQSEENIREVFHRARNASPCVIFFDELDSLAPNRGRSGDSGGVMDRVVSQLLAELDGLHKAANVFVIGATNRPDLLDPALLRPGRFDKLLYLGVSEDRSSQLKILEALTRKFELDPSLQLSEIVQKLPYNLTGADLYALCSDAMLSALKRKIHSLDQGEEVDQSSVEVTESDFSRAVEAIIPSVSLDELRHYKSVQAQFNTSKLKV